MTARRLLLLGPTGRLGSQVCRLAEESWDVAARGRETIDFRSADDDDFARLLGQTTPDVVLNAIAMANVDGCETAREDALAVNGAAPGRLARACARAGVPLLHISTDYVFGDGPGPHAEDAPYGPVQWYGETKRAGEERALQTEARVCVARVSWLFGRDVTPFSRFVLAQVDGSERPVGVHGWQSSRPTFLPALGAWLLAAASAMTEGGDVPRILHPAGGPWASRADWARVILDEAGYPSIPVVEQGSGGTMVARRPADTRLDSARTDAWSASAGLPSLGDWRDQARAAVGPRNRDG